VSGRWLSAQWNEPTGPHESVRRAGDPTAADILRHLQDRPEMAAEVARGLAARAAQDDEVCRFAPMLAAVVSGQGRLCERCHGTGWVPAGGE
jgi:hypothetical protein